jgi:hypothetical protein
MSQCITIGKQEAEMLLVTCQAPQEFSGSGNGGEGNFGTTDTGGDGGKHTPVPR